MFEIGRICVKIAGRDAGGKCVVIDVLDKNYVVIAGDVRKRRCNISHLEPLTQRIEINKGAGDEDIRVALSEAGIALRQTKPKPAVQRPRKIRDSQKKENKQEGREESHKKNEPAAKKEAKAKSHVKKAAAKAKSGSA